MPQMSQGFISTVSNEASYVRLTKDSIKMVAPSQYPQMEPAAAPNFVVTQGCPP